MKKWIIYALSLCFASALFATVDPGVLQIKLYKFAVSTSENCTNLSTIWEDDSPGYTNVLESPTFGQANIDDGTYPCVVFEMSDNIKYTALTAIGDGSVCTTNTTYTLDVCRGDNSTLIDGTSVTCVEGEDRVAMYLSTGVEDNELNVFDAPTEANSGGVLANAMVVSGDLVANFVVDGSDKVEVREEDGEDDTCEMGKPDFSFSVVE